MSRPLGVASEQGGVDVRLDKWLWAARFYKTRSIAKTAIEAGHVRYLGERTKVGRAVRIGDSITVRQGWDDREVIVRGLSDKRRGAPEARQLYEETPDSVLRREDNRVMRKSGPSFDQVRPERNQRRLASRLKRGDTPGG